VLGRERGFAAKERTSISRSVTVSYRDAMQQFASMRTLDLWYAHIDVDDLVQRFAADTPQRESKRLQQDLAKARTRDSMKALAKLTQVVDGRRRIVSDPPLIVPVDELAGPEHAELAHAAISGLLRDYRRTLAGDRRRLIGRFRYADAARKVVGVGSVGTRAWIVLMLGRDDDDPLFLQAKEAGPSVLEPYLGRTPYANHGQRVVEGQRLMQSASDILLGWLRDKTDDPRDLYVRQLWDQKGSPAVDTMPPADLADYGRLCGWTLAKGHARSGDPVAIASYLGTGDVFDVALGTFAEHYAEQNERDYEALQQAAASGRIEAQRGM